MKGIRWTLTVLILCGVVAPPSALAQDIWSLPSTPNVGEASQHNRLLDIGCDPVALAACTAVGIRSTDVDWPLALRWDGVSWSPQSPALKLFAPENRLFGVDCPSATRCIAVGNYKPMTSGPATLAEIWNGGSWSVQSTPSPPSATSSELTAVGCNSTAECTAVGNAVVGGVKTAIAERWKSPTWTLQSVPIPAGAISSQLDGVACRWSNYCVAVGRYTTSVGVTKSLAMFWNGSSWSLQTLTEPAGATQSTLLDASCAGQPAVCMAVGGWKNGNDGNKQFTLAYRFNGSSWTLQSTPNPSGSIASVFQDVSCKTTMSCAAVGSWVSGSGGSNQTLAEDWDGANWSIQSTPNPSGATFSALFGLACRAQGCMGAGYSTNSSGVNRTLSALRAAAPKNYFTYSIGIGPSGFPEGWGSALRAAMQVWSEWTPLTFTEVLPGIGDLEFSWQWEYGSGQLFDGPGGKVVRAYGPLESLPGDIYFDQAESWTANGGPAIDIQAVAENAVGRALGVSSGTSYETNTSSQRGLTIPEVAPAIEKYGPHPDQRRYFLRNSNATGTPDIVFETPADGPDSEFSGDWNGDGYDTIGWHEQNNFFGCGYPLGSCPDHLFIYSEPHTSGVNTPEAWTDSFALGQIIDETRDYLGLYLGWPGERDALWYHEDDEFYNVSGDHILDFGENGDIPLAGDWDNDGKDSVGVFRRSNSTFYLTNSTATGSVDIVIPSYAIPGDQPVAGDWNGDGRDTIGIYRPSSGQWRLNDENANNTPEHVFYYGNVGGWVRIVGDWNGDGKDTPGFAQD